MNIKGKKKERSSAAKPAKKAGPGNGVFRQVLDRIVSKESLSILLMILFSVGALLSMHINPQFYRAGIYEGDVALRDIFAPHDFVYLWGIDEKTTDEKRAEKVSEVPFVFVRELSAEESSFAGLSRFFSLLDDESEKEITLAERMEKIRSLSGDELSDRDIRFLTDLQDKGTVAKNTKKIIEKIFQTGFLSEDDAALVSGEGIGSVAIVDEDRGEERILPVEEIITPDLVTGKIDAYIEELFPAERRLRGLLSPVIRENISPNMSADKSRTLIRREKAASSVKPVPKEWEVRKNEIIVTKGQRVTGRDMAQLMHVSGFFRQGATVRSFAGSTFFFAIMWILSIIYLSFSRVKFSLKDTRDIAIVLLNMTITLVLADIIMRSPQPSYFMPLASMGMIITLLIGVNIGLLCTIMMGMFISLLAGGQVEIMFVLLTGGIVGIYSIRDCRRRSDILRAGIFVGIAKTIAIVCVGLMKELDMDFFLRDGAWGIGSGMLSAFLVMGLLPVFEYLFKVPTNITLLELSDLNHPLLKKLSLEAPGTYHHSILVGNLAEAACDEVGANSLLARVGAYYHDIGKIPKSEYFSENEMGGASRHSNLSPSMSALIISKHVKEGVEMAKKYKLQRNILDIIEQHHGNSLIAYFYKKALEKSDDKNYLKEENFRYPGPRPQTRESAIIMLADSVEASSRALEEPTPASIKQLVKKIINNKFIDGQLDECDLTLKGIEKIALSFERVLLGVYHTRLNYPDSAPGKGVSEVKKANENKRGNNGDRSGEENRS